MVYFAPAAQRQELLLCVARIVSVGENDYRLSSVGNLGNWKSVTYISGNIGSMIWFINRLIILNGSLADSFLLLRAFSFLFKSM